MDTEAITTPVGASYEFTSVVLENVAVREDGCKMPLSFKRVYAPADLIQIVKIGTRDNPPSPPRKTISSDQQIVDRLDEKIGSGRGGLVYSIEESTAHHGSDHPGFPPLVAKFAGHYRNKFQAREAWFYDELESLQGSVIPRFYGWYTADLPDGWKLVAWEDDMTRRKPNKEKNEGTFEVCGAFVDTAQPFLDRIENEKCVSFLLLELCGEPFLPVGEKIPEQTVSDVNDAYEELARFSIEHFDIRYSNILKAPASPPGLPNLPSPHFNRQLGCRIIDFEISRKTNEWLKGRQFSYEGWINRMLRNLPSGYHLGQHDDE